MEIQVHARLQYWDRASFDRACRLLEDKHQLGLVEVCPYGIFIPWANYWSIDRYLDDLFEGATGLAVWSDLERQGRVIRDGYLTDDGFDLSEEELAELDGAFYDDSDWWGWVDHVGTYWGWTMVLAWDSARDDSFHMRVRQFREPDDDEGVDYGNSEFNQTIVGEFWLRNGELHRDDGPAVTTFLPDGDVAEEFWYFDSTQTGPHLAPTLSPDSGDTDSATAVAEPHLWPARGPKYWPHLSTFVEKGPSWETPEQLEEQIPAFVEGLPRYWYRQGEQVDLHEPVKRETAHGESYFLRDGTLVAQNWLKNGDLHREGGPASITYWPDGTIRAEEWHQHGRFHRDTRPTRVTYHPDGTLEKEEWHTPDGAVVFAAKYQKKVEHFPDGTLKREEWFRNEKRHRENGPAVIESNPDGIKLRWVGTVHAEDWYFDDELHRDDGPASILRFADGGHAELWYRNGKKHRDVGPAVEIFYAEGSPERQEWHRNGKPHRNDGPAVLEYHPDGSPRALEWYRDGEHYRPAGPAVEGFHPDGSPSALEWYRDGWKHMQDGPAVLGYHPDGTLERQEWYRDGKEHREDGPAVEGFYEDGTPEWRSWYRDGKKHRPDGPAYERFYPDGSPELQEWYRDGKEHRADGPAIVEFYADGTPKSRKWHRYGMRHRDDGPAVEEFYADGTPKAHAWYREGERHRGDDWVVDELHDEVTAEG